MTIYPTAEEAFEVAQRLVTPEVRARVLAENRDVVVFGLENPGIRVIKMPVLLPDMPFYQHPTDGPLPVFGEVAFTKDDL